MYYNIMDNAFVAVTRFVFSIDVVAIPVCLMQIILFTSYGFLFLLFPTAFVRSDSVSFVVTYIFLHAEEA